MRDCIIKSLLPAKIAATLEDLSGLGERVAGSEAERRASTLIENDMRSLGLDDVVVEEFNVSLWHPRHSSLEVVGCSGGVRIQPSAVAPNPYSSGECEAEVIYIPGGGVCEDVWRDRNVEGKVALTEWPCGTSVYNIKYTVINAQKYGACGLIVYDCVFGGFLRKIVVAGNYARLGELAYSFRHGGTPDENVVPIPVISITREDGFKLLQEINSGNKLHARISVDARVVPDAVDRNVIGMLYGKKDYEWVTVGAHYDSWFQGASDNSVSVALLVELARAFSSERKGNLDLKRSLVFIAYGAEESGGINFEPWYWIRGSRAFVERHLDEVVFNYNLDAVIAPLNIHKIRINTMGYETLKFFLKRFEGSELHSRYEITITPFKNAFYMSGSDHYPYIVRGIPIATLHNGDLGHYYHTNKDVPELLIPIINNQLPDVATLITDPLLALLECDEVPLEPISNVEEMMKVIRLNKETVSRYSFKGNELVNELYSHLERLENLLEGLKPLLTGKSLRELRSMLEVLYKEFRVVNTKYVNNVETPNWENYRFITLAPLIDIVGLIRAYSLLERRDVELSFDILKKIPVHRIIPGAEITLPAPSWIREILESRNRALETREISEKLVRYIINYVDDYREFLLRRLQEIEAEAGRIQHGHRKTSTV